MSRAIVKAISVVMERMADFEREFVTKPVTFS